MRWKSIIVGVDGSPESMRAVELARNLGTAAGATCYPVHAVRDPWADMTSSYMAVDLVALNQSLIVAGHARIEQALREADQAAMIDRLQVQMGRPAVVMGAFAEQLGAELIVLGGKHHTVAGRWLGGSTAHDLVRTVNLPLLITGPGASTIRRILAAVDLSDAARGTIELAERFATRLGAKLRVMHSVEPVPLIPGFPVSITDEDVWLRSNEELERTVWPLISHSDAEHLVRRGGPADAIASAAGDWSADLVVVGSHGRGWIDRLLIGSVTERLINRLPASLLVAPVSRAAKSTLFAKDATPTCPVPIGRAGMSLA